MHVGKILETALLCGLVLVGCGAEEDASSSIEGVLHDPAGYSVTVLDEAFTMHYDTATDSIQELFSACLKKADVTSCKQINGGDGHYRVTIQLPALEEYLKDGVADVGYKNDVQKLQVGGASEDEIADYMVEFITAAVDAGVTPLRNVETEVVFSDGVIAEMEALGDYLLSISRAVQKLDLTGEADAVSEGEEAEQYADPDFADRKCIQLGGSFVYSDANARFLVMDVQLVTGTEAIDALKELSPVNDVEYDGGELYFVKYRVQALTRGRHNTASHFVLTNDDGELYDNDLTVVGLSNSAQVSGKDHEGVEMSTCLLGPADAHLVWWLDDERGTCEIVK